MGGWAFVGSGLGDGGWAGGRGLGYEAGNGLGSGEVVAGEMEDFEKDAEAGDVLG